MVRYIHSGDFVEVKKKEQSGSPEKENGKESREGEVRGRTEDMEASGELGTGAEKEITHLDTEAVPEAGTADLEGNDAAEATEGSSDTEAGSAAGKAPDESGKSEEDLDGSGKDKSEDNGKGFLAKLFSADAEAADEPGMNGQGGEGPGADNAPAGDGDAEQGADVGVDAGATGYAEADDLEVSNVEPGQEQGQPGEAQGEAPVVEGSSDTEAGSNSSVGSSAHENETSTAGVQGEPGAESPAAAASIGAEESAEKDHTGGNQPAENTEDSGVQGQRQDAEAADELGTSEPESEKKGFFARLFGDDEQDEEEDESDDEAGTGTGVQRTKSASGGKKEEKRGKKESRDSNHDPMQEKRDNEHSDSLEQSIIYWHGEDKISPDLEVTKKTLTEVLGLGSSFDIVFREMSFGGRKAALLCISGFAKDTIIDEILKRLTYLTPDNVSTDVVASFMGEYIPHIQVEKGEILSESINKVLTGMSVFFIEGETQVILMDTRSYPSRSPDEPSIERVVRGSRDGFTETLLSNVALVRRRIRDPGLKYEMHQVGRRTRTDVCVAYIDDIVDKTQVKAVTDKIKSVDLDGIPLADKQLEEAIVGAGWNPYPMVRYSERPDVVASHLLEGRVVVFVDTSPSVMVLPTTFFDLCQHAEENRQTPFMGTYLRWVRFIGIFASMFLLPLWMLLVIHPELKPPMLEFIGPQKMAKIPLLAQFLLVELGVDLLRMAAVHTPTPLGSAMGLIAAILVGDIAVQTGLFVNEVVLYMAVASIGMFATPSYELGLANRTVRLGLLFAVAAFNVPGFMIGTTLLVILLTTHRSYNSSYLWPFIPFNAKAMGEIIVRRPVLNSKTRPSFNKTRDNTRMPPTQENEQQS